MTKMPKYNGQDIVATCLIHHNMMCENTYHPCFCAEKASKQMKSINGLYTKITY